MVILILPWLDAYASLLGSGLALSKLLILIIGVFWYVKGDSIKCFYITFVFFFYLIANNTVFGVLNSQSIMTNLDISFRLVFPFLFILFFHQKIENYNNIDGKLKLFFFSLFFAAVSSLLVGVISGYGGVIEGRGSTFSGNKGFYIGANEVGVILCILTLLMHMVIKGEKSVSIILSLIIIFCGVLVFTKSSLIASLLAMFFLWVNVSNMRPIFVLALMFIIFYFLHNISIFWGFIEGSFFNTLFTDPLSFLFRGRQTYIDGFLSEVILYDSSLMAIIQVFLGNGDWQTAQWIGHGIGVDSPLRTTFEMDFFDLLSALGVIGIGFYVFFIVKLFSTIINSTFSQNKRSVKISLLAILAHSFLAGHVVFSIQVTILLAIIYVFSKVKKNNLDSNNKVKL